MLFLFEQKKVIILGLNDLSLNLAQKLSLNNDVIILYYQKKIKRELIENVDVLTEKIDTNFLDLLNKQNIDERTIFIALTRNEEINLFTSELAKNKGVLKSISMVTDLNYIKYNFNIDLVFNPYQVLLDKIGVFLKNTRLASTDSLIEGKLNISRIKIKNEDSFSYLRLNDINLKKGKIIAVQRKEKIFIPEGDTRIYPDDYLFIIYKKGTYDWLKGFKNKNLHKKKLFIFGGNDLGIYLAESWNHLVDIMIFIEPDFKRCEYLATVLEKPIILHGEGTDLNLLQEEGLKKSSIFMALSKNDTENILSSFGAVKLGCKSVLTLINSINYQAIANLINLTNVLLIPEIISEYIMTYIDKGVKLNKKIFGKMIYVKELKPGKKYSYYNKKIRDIDLPSGIIIGAIKKENRYIIPDQDYKLKVGDRLIIFFKRKLEKRISSIFN